MTDVINKLKKINNKKKSVIIVYAEGCEFGSLNEFSQKIKDSISNSNVRFSILGHIQRGGIPSPSDRILASILGYESINQIIKGKTNKMIGIKNQKPILINLDDVISKKKNVDLSLIEISNII